MGRMVVAVGGVLLSLSALADEFSVGRVEVQFAEEGWKALTLPESTSAYKGDTNGALAVQSKLYVHEGADSQSRVLVLVSVTTGGIHGGYMTYSPSCRSDENNYREGNSGIRRSFAQCLLVTPLYSRESVFKALAPAVLELQRWDTASTQRPVYTLWNYHAIASGETVDVRVFVESPMAVPGVVAEPSLPSGVPPAHVAWGRQLIEAVKSSVLSLSGRLAIPAIQLAPAAPPAPAPGTGPAA